MNLLPTLLNPMPLQHVWPTMHLGDLAYAFERASEAAASTLFNAVWQSALLALVLAGLLKLTPRAAASLRFALWSAGFLALVLLPFLRALPRLSTTPAISFAAAQTHGASAWLQMDVRWSFAVGSIWLAVSLYRAAGLVGHSIRLRRLWTTALPVQSQETVAFGILRRPVQICTTTKLDRPGVIGFFAPRILIPEWLYAQLSQAELKQIVLHELEHLRRGDDWTNLFQKLSLVIFPLNPVLLWMERQLCLEREMACDEGVIETTRAPRAYATCLTRLAERGLQHRSEALSLGAWQRRPELARRIHSILRGKQLLQPRAAQALLAAVVCSLAFGSFELSRAPQLVAFVPASRSATQVASAAILPHRNSSFVSTQIEPAHLIRTGFEEQSNIQEGVKPRMTEVRAIMPSSAGTSFEVGRKSELASAHFRSVSHSPRALDVAAKFPTVTAETDALQAQTDQPREQWIVLTAWLEQPAPRQSAESAQPGDLAESARQAIVTEVVFHVITERPAEPAAKKTAQPTALPAKFISLPPRAGWLFFQL